MGNANSESHFLKGISLHEVFNCIRRLHEDAEKEALLNLTHQVVSSLVRDQGMTLYLNRGAAGSLLKLDENSRVISAALQELCYLPTDGTPLAERVWFVEFESGEYADA